MRVPKFYALKVNAMSLQSAAAFTVLWAVLDPSGRTVVGGFDVVTSSARNPGSAQQQLPEGVLQVVEVRASTPAGNMGQSRASAILVSTDGVINKPRLVIFEGPCTEIFPAMWTLASGWRSNSVDDVPGLFNVTTPAAGDPASVNVPALDIIEINYVAVDLVTSAAVASRLVQIQLSDGITTRNRIVASGPQTASLAFEYVFMDRIGASANTATRIFSPMGRVGQAGANGFTVTAFSLQAADQISNVWVQLRWRLGIAV